MKIGIVGIGYVGLTYAVGMSYLGNKVVAIDLAKDKIENLNRGILPIYDYSLNSQFQKEKQKISFSTDYKELRDCDAIFICVGTPEDKNHEVNLSNLWNSLKSLKQVKESGFIFLKSTVPMGTNKKAQELLGRKFTVISNPEFLREGNALNDFLNPTRLVFGSESSSAKGLINKLFSYYRDKQTPFIFTDWQTAELIKYTSNSFLALKISFMNELSRLCHKTNANIVDIKKAIGIDPRIGEHFLDAGIGYGGSCLTKDVKAFIKQFEKNGLKNQIISAADSINESQVQWFREIIREQIGNLKNKSAAVLGLSFKPNTDDLRRSKAIDIINELKREGVKVKAFDYLEKARENAKNILGENTIYSDLNQCLNGVDFVVIATEHREFNSKETKRLIEENGIKHVFDGRNIIDNDFINVKYTGVGKKRN